MISPLHFRQDTIPVIQCCSGRLNPIKWDRIVKFIEVFFNKYPLDEIFRVPSTHFHSSRFLFDLNNNVKHQFPAYVMDFLARITGKKPK